MRADSVKEALARENEFLAETLEADYATRDTNDGSTYCNNCGAPQPKRRGAKWQHDPLCTVAFLRDRAREHRSAKATEKT